MPPTTTISLCRRLIRGLPACAGIVLAGALALLSGCASQGAGTGALEYPDWLLSGDRLFDEPVDHVPELEIASVTDEMRAYVAGRVGDQWMSGVRFQRLFDGLLRDGFFVYTAEQTRTAAEAFEARSGNCLSYTNLFVALAREAGLDAVYQVVDVPPSWDADSGFLIRYTHINALIKNVTLPGRRAGSVTVDFNSVRPDPDHPRREVSDAYARSLFYANRSIALLRAGDRRESFAYLRRALDMAPENHDLWINLGAFYATQGEYEGSVAAYQVALQLDGRSRAALSGLARGHAAIGDTELAARYEQKARNYRDANPWYHYAMAQAAFEAAELERSLDHIEAAIALKRRTPTFYVFRGLVQQKLGDSESAQESFRRAERLGLDRGSKLDMLRSLAGTGAS